MYHVGKRLSPLFPMSIHEHESVERRRAQGAVNESPRDLNRTVERFRGSHESENAEHQQCDKSQVQENASGCAHALLAFGAVAMSREAVEKGRRGASSSGGASTPYFPFIFC